MVGWSLWMARSAGAATLQVGATRAYTTLQDALDAAQGGDTIELDPGVYEGAFALGDKALEIVGVDGSASTTLAPPAADPPAEATVYVEGKAQITLRGLTIDGAHQQFALDLQHADLLGDDLVLLGAEPDVTRELEIFKSTASFVGLSLDAPVAHLTWTGGHVESLYSTVTFQSSTFSGGSTIDGIGGAIYTYATDITFQDCTFTDNDAAEGGAVFLEQTPRNVAILTGTTFEGNDATSGPGGALFVLDGQLQMTGVAIRNSSSTEPGGALSHVSGKYFSFTDGAIEHNHGPLGGGIAVLDGASVTVQRTTFDDDVSDSDGGGLVILSPTDDVDVSGNLFCANGAVTGGGLELDAGPAISASIHNNVFQGNSASSQGGAIAVLGASATVTQNTVVDSVSGAQKGALYAGRGAVVTNTDNAWTYNQGIGVYSDPPVSVDGGYNLYFGNDANLGDPTGTQNDGTWSDVRANPQFAHYVAGDCTSDLRPAKASPLVDGGDPVVFDDDGTRADIGAYGGAGAAQLLDIDGDGVIAGDCAPYDPTKITGTDEVVADQVDQDCDGLDLCWVDADGDGVGGDQTTPGPIGCAEPGLSLSTGDCDDADPSVAADCTPSEGGGHHGPELRPVWFCSTTGPIGVPGAAWAALGLAALRRTRRGARPAAD